MKKIYIHKLLKEKPRNKYCEICKKRMWWWQDVVLTTGKYGMTIPFYHTRCER